MPFILEPVFLWLLWSLKLFITAKEPFNKYFSFFSFHRNPSIWKARRVLSVNEMIFWLPAKFWRQALKATKIPHSHDLVTRVTANQIIFHTFREKSRGLLTRQFFLGGGGWVCTQANNLKVDTTWNRWYKRFTLAIVMSRWLVCFSKFVKLNDLNVTFIHLPFPYHVLRIPSITRAQTKQPP